jgi:hypothetical protein
MNNSIVSRRRDWRAIIFRIVVVALAGLILSGPGGLADLIAPWRLTLQGSHGMVSELHRWHSADIAALITLIIAGGMLALVPRPRQSPLVAQFVIFATATLAITVRGEALVPCLIIGGAFTAAYPPPRALLSFRIGSQFSRPLLAVAITTLPFLAVNVWMNTQRLLHDTSEHAALGHWHGSVALAIVLACGGLVAAAKRPDAAALSGLLALTYAYLGAAALTLPLHDGSWGVAGGVLALVAASAYCAATIVTARRTTERPAARAARVSLAS